MGKLYLITGDIIEKSKNMDAIVNAQNKYMIQGSGICGAIYNASGPKLQQYCNNTYKNNMIDGEARITPGFNLNMDIIHILAPKAFEQKEPIDALIKTYNNLLTEITKNNYKKIIIPSLGTGYHGYHHEDVSKPVIELLSNYCKEHEVEIYFINYQEEYTNIYKKELELLTKGE